MIMINSKTKLIYYLRDKYHQADVVNSTAGELKKEGYTPSKALTCRDCTCEGLLKSVAKFGWKDGFGNCEGGNGRASFERFDKRIGCLGAHIKFKFHKDFEHWLIVDGNNYARFGRLVKLFNGQIWLFINKRKLKRYRYLKAQPEDLSHMPATDWQIANANRPSYAGNSRH